MTAAFDPSQPLYKYTKRAYAEAMVRDGKVRIGTLHDYRRVEDYGGAVGDVFEGISDIVEHIERAEWPEIQQHPMASRLISAPPDAQITITNATISQPQDSPDYFIYCMTSKPTAEGLAEFGNDACVQISEPITFCEIVGRELARLGLATRGVIGACTYGTRQRSWAEAQQVHPALLKDPVFSYQCEVRALWEPATRPLPSYVDLTCPAAAGLLSLYEVPDASGARAPTRHSFRYDDEELLRRTGALVETLVEMGTEPGRAYRRVDEARNHEDFDRMTAEWSASVDQLNRRLNEGLRADLAAVVRDYANRGIRDRRVERALIGHQNPGGIMDMAGALQRLGELLEMRLAVANGRTMSLEREASYRFWARPAHGFGYQLGGDSLAAVERQVGAADRDATAFPRSEDNPALGSQRRTNPVVVSLPPSTRSALARVVQRGSAPPSEVLEAILAARHGAL